MKVSWGLENASYNANTATTLGSYDGMHRGHLEILRHLIKKKGDLGLERSLVVTFDPHPQEILHKNNTAIKLLTTIDERLALLNEVGVDEVLVIRFSHEFARIPYNDFFNEILLRTLGTKAMIVGFNHAFGKNREGDTEHLKMLTSQAGIAIDEVPPLIINGISISSTKIRNAISEGNLTLANEYLGRPYELSGIVEEGDRIGRTIGFPTANLKIASNKLIPIEGVYAGNAILGESQYLAAISIGNRPTILDSGDQKIEAYLLNFDHDIYGKKLTLQLHSFVRKQEKFDSIELLIDQMHNDVNIIKNLSNIS